MQSPRYLANPSGVELSAENARKSKRKLGFRGISRADAVRWLLPNATTVLIVALLVLTQNVWAAPSKLPTAQTAAETATFAYQGRLADANGAPLTGPYPMIFRLYNVTSGGTSLWEEEWSGANSIQVTDGLFNVMLGTITPISQDVTNVNSALYLGITVGSDDEMIPRMRIGSVPFAVQSLGVPDNSISTSKIADGAVTRAKLASDVGLGVDADILRWELADDIPMDATGGYASRVVNDTGLQITVPQGETHMFLALYEGSVGHMPGEGLSDHFYGTWAAELLATSQVIGPETTLLQTGYRVPFSAVGGLYWWREARAHWLFELGEGTHDIKVNIKGYSDGTMNTVHVRYQKLQMVRLH